MIQNPLAAGCTLSRGYLSRLLSFFLAEMLFAEESSERKFCPHSVAKRDHGQLPLVKMLIPLRMLGSGLGNSSGRTPTNIGHEDDYRTVVVVSFQ